jgi:RluA family pseudouridine synthase
MSARRKKPKRSPKKRGHQPRGLKILYEDRDMIVVDKSSGLLTVGSDKERDRTAYAGVTNFVRKGVEKSSNRVFIVHRLDRETSGVLVFAKHEDAKKFLQGTWLDFQKTYCAVVHGRMPKQQGEIESYLAERGVHKMYSTREASKGKLSKTQYRVVKEVGDFSMLEIKILTGRKHQIRVHLADAGCPVVGDKKYGDGKDKGAKRLALHAQTLVIAHPHTKEEMSFTAEVPGYFESLMVSA